MRHCPNPDCPHRARFGRASEFVDEVERCRDCGADLAGGDAPASEREKTSFPLLRLLVTVGAALMTVLAGWIELPGVAPPTRYGTPIAVPSILALGVIPFTTAAMLVELVAVAVPKLRPMRFDARRTRLARATLLLTLALATLQAWGIVQWMRALDFDAWSVARVALLVSTMVGGVFLLIAAASVIDRRGLGNGIGVVFATSVLLEAGKNLLLGLAGGALLPVVVALLVGLFVALVVLVTRIAARPVSRRGVTLRAPLSGIDPAVLPAGLLSLPITLANLGLAVPRGLGLVHGTEAHAIVTLTIAVVATVPFAFAFHRVRNVRRVVDAGERAVTAARWSALRPTLILVIGVTAIGLAFVRVAPALHLAASSLAVAIAVVVDVVEDARARSRHPDLVAIAALHRVYAVDPVVDALARAAIRAHARSLRYRAMLQFFGPWAPIVIEVPAADVARAKELADAVLSGQVRGTEGAGKKLVQADEAPRSADAGDEQDR